MARRCLVRGMMIGVVVAGITGCGARNSPSGSGSVSSSNSPESGRPSPSPQATSHVLQGSARVTFQPQVHVIEKDDAVKALKGFSRDGNGFIFDTTYAPAAALKPGDVLLIKNMLARKVLATESTADGIIVITSRASLVDVVKDGHIGMNASLHFKSGQKTAYVAHPIVKIWSDVMPVSTAFAQDPGWSNNTRNPSLPIQPPGGVGHNEQTGSSVQTTLKNLNNSPYLKPFKGTLQDWETEWEATPDDGKINLHLTMSKNINGIVAKITGEGYIADFDFINDMDFGSSPSSVRSALRQAAGQFKNINGAMNFTWELGKSTPGPGGEAETIKLPGALSIPLSELLEGIPLSLEVSAAIQPHPMMTGGNQYSSGAFHVTYDGYQRFKFDNGNMDSDGTMGGEPTADTPRNISAVAPFGVAVAFAAPRIDLVFGGEALISDDLQKDAEHADLLIDQAAKRLLSSDSYQLYKSSGFSMGGAAAAFEHTSATLSLRIITSATMTASGSSQMALPCSKSTVELSAWVGLSAQALGLSGGSTSKRVMEKNYEKIEPEGTRLCSQI